MKKLRDKNKFLIPIIIFIFLITIIIIASQTYLSPSSSLSSSNKNNQQQLIEQIKSQIPNTNVNIVVDSLLAKGDCNCDGFINFNDINPFVLALSNPDEYKRQFPNCGIMTADCNNDGSINFNDINPFVKILTCSGNRPPVANAGADKQGVVNQEITFDGSLSTDPDNNIDSYEWDFGDGTPKVIGEVVTHKYSYRGNYLARLKVNDTCKAESFDDVDVVISEDGELTACFEAYELIEVKENGEEVWVKRDINTYQFEAGLNISLDASCSSGGAYHYDWTFGDGTYGGGKEVRHQFAMNRNVKLTVYTQDWMKSNSVYREIKAQETFKLFGATRSPQGEFFPRVAIQAGDYVWAVSYSNELGYVDFSAPDNGNGKNVQLTAEQVPSVSSLVVYQNYLYMPVFNEGVRIYTSSPHDFRLVGRINKEDLGGGIATEATLVGDMIYIATYNPNQIHIFELTNPTMPRLIKSLNLPGTITDIGSPGKNYAVATLEYPVAASAQVFDAIDPKNPKPLPLIEIPESSGAAGMIGATDHAVSVGLQQTKGAQLIQISYQYDPYGKPTAVLAKLGNKIGTGTESVVFFGNRLYAPVGQGYFYKFDTANPQSAYEMNKFRISARVADLILFQRESDGTNLLVVNLELTGFLIYSP